MLALLLFVLQIRTELQELQQGLEAMESHLTAAAATCTHSEPHLPQQYAFVAAAHESLQRSVKAESAMTELSERLSAYFGKAGEHERVLGALKDFGPMVGSALKALQATPDVTLVEDSNEVDENAGVATRQREGKAASTRALGKQSGRPGLSPRDGNGGLGGLGAAVALQKRTVSANNRRRAALAALP